VKFLDACLKAVIKKSKVIRVAILSYMPGDQEQTLDTAKMTLYIYGTKNIEIICTIARIL